MTSEQATERKKPWRGLVEIGLFVALLLAFAWFQQRDMLLADGSVTIPEHQFVSLEGQTLPLLAADKPTLVYFFAPWCKVCRWSINNVDELDQSKVNVVKVALSYSNLEAVAQFVQETQTQRDNMSFRLALFPVCILLSRMGVWSVAVLATPLNLASSSNLPLVYEYACVDITTSH
jgi:thiol-disulfide isomerase/thioredoxin